MGLCDICVYETLAQLGRANEKIGGLNRQLNILYSNLEHNSKYIEWLKKHQQ
jgi:hypothetical protein